MERSDRLIDIIEDHASVCQFIDCVNAAISNGTDMPNFVPVLHDTLLTDQLGFIAETITNLRKKLL